MAEENGNRGKKDRVWEIITQGSIPDKTLVKLNDIFRNKGSGLDMWYICSKIGKCAGSPQGTILARNNWRKGGKPKSQDTSISIFRIADILFLDTRKALEESGVQVEVTGYWEFIEVVNTEKEGRPQVETGLDRLRVETSQCSQ